MWLDILKFFLGALAGGVISPLAIISYKKFLLREKRREIAKYNIKKLIEDLDIENGVKTLNPNYEMMGSKWWLPVVESITNYDKDIDFKELESAYFSQNYKLALDWAYYFLKCL